MTYFARETFEELIAIAGQNEIVIKEESLKDLIDSDEEDSQEVDEQIAMEISERNEKAGYWLSVGNMGENEQCFIDLFIIALEKLGITNYQHKSQYIESSKSEDIEITIDAETYKHNFEYDFTNEIELATAFSTIAKNHSGRRIVEAHCHDFSLLLFLPDDLANFLDEKFTFMAII